MLELGDIFRLCLQSDRCTVSCFDQSCWRNKVGLYSLNFLQVLTVFQMNGQARAEAQQFVRYVWFPETCIIHTETTVLFSVCESIATFVSVLLSPTAAKFPIKDRRIFIEKHFMGPKISDYYHYIRQIKVLSRNVILWNYVPL